MKMSIEVRISRVDTDVQKVLGTWSSEPDDPRAVPAAECVVDYLARDAWVEQTDGFITQSAVELYDNYTSSDELPDNVGEFIVWIR